MKNLVQKKLSYKSCGIFTFYFLGIQKLPLSEAYLLLPSFNPLSPTLRPLASRSPSTLRLRGTKRRSKTARRQVLKRPPPRSPPSAPSPTESTDEVAQTPAHRVAGPDEKLLKLLNPHMRGRGEMHVPATKDSVRKKHKVVISGYTTHFVKQKRSKLSSESGQRRPKNGATRVGGPGSRRHLCFQSAFTQITGVEPQ